MHIQSLFTNTVRITPFPLSNVIYLKQPSSQVFITTFLLLILTSFSLFPNPTFLHFPFHHGRTPPSTTPLHQTQTVKGETLPLLMFCSSPPLCLSDPSFSISQLTLCLIQYHNTLLQYYLIFTSYSMWDLPSPTGSSRHIWNETESSKTEKAG